MAQTIHSALDAVTNAQTQERNQERRAAALRKDTAQTVRQSRRSI